MSPRSVDLIVPVYRSARLTGQCLDSLFEHLDEIAHLQPRVVAIDDSPDDPEVGELLDSFAGRFANFVALTNPVNVGFVASVNRGIAMALRSGRDVLLVNSDTLTFRGTLAELVRVAHADPMLGFVSPRSNNASISSLPLSLSNSRPSPQQAYDRWKLLSATMPAFHYAPTAVGFYFFAKHKVLANFGGMRDDFGVGYEEENELVMRANRAGYKAALANHAFAYHHGSASFSLRDIDLVAHRQANLEKHCRLNPEFLPLVHRYQASAHYRAEMLLDALLPDERGRYRILFDLANLGPSFNGTNEMAIAVIGAFCARHAGRFTFFASCTKAAFAFHGLDRLANLTRVSPARPGRYAIAIRLGQPFLQWHVDHLEQAGAINVYGMLDTIAEDCGHLSITQNLDPLWRYVASHANGIFFISRFSEQSFEQRYGRLDGLRRHTRLLPTRLDAYRKGAPTAEPARHILVLGNHFPHKGADAAVERLFDASSDEAIVVLGAETFSRGRLTGYQSGSLSAEEVQRLFAQASVVVLPSHVEGFGFGLLHALAAGRPVAARDIAATREILDSYRASAGIHLFDDDGELVDAVRRALESATSSVDDSDARGWEDWVDDFAGFCHGLLTHADLFDRLVDRIRAGDQLRELNRDGSARLALPGAAHLDELLSHDGEAFVHLAYCTLLHREPDEVGQRNFLYALSTGTSKQEIVQMIASSPEGRNVGAELPGLEIE